MLKVQPKGKWKDEWKKTEDEEYQTTLIRFIDFIEHKEWRKVFSI